MLQTENGSFSPIMLAINGTTELKCNVAFIRIVELISRNKKEAKKKKLYNERVSQIENGSFSPIMFAINGATELKCNVAFIRIVELISRNKGHCEISSNEFYTHKDQSFL